MSNGKKETLLTAPAVTDPGKDKASKEEKTSERLKVWKRPDKKEDKDALRKERLSHIGGGK
jgi:hypothetical protein